MTPDPGALPSRDTQAGRLLDEVLKLAPGTQPFLPPTVRDDVMSLLRACGRHVRPVRTVFRAVDVLLDLEQAGTVRMPTLHGLQAAPTLPPG